MEYAWMELVIVSLDSREKDVISRHAIAIVVLMASVTMVPAYVKEDGLEIIARTEK
jgi:hypothetical protein